MFGKDKPKVKVQTSKEGNLQVHVNGVTIVFPSGTPVEIKTK